MSKSCDVLIYVQHLLGIGHLKRAALIARTLAERNRAVTLVSGGFPVPNLDMGAAELIQLPPLRSADEAFSALVGEDGREIDEAWKAARRDALLALFGRLRPRLLVTELFPFGRRQLRFELTPLLEAAARARPRPLLVSSVRDLLNPPIEAHKLAWMAETFERCYDRVVVHGDPRVVPFEVSFPPAAVLGDRLIYSGYVAEHPARAWRGRGVECEVLVSTGGGAVAGPLIEASLAARPISRLSKRPWRVLVGANLPEPAFRAYREKAPPGVVVERARSDFFERLNRCALSISQGGYNTVLDVLAAGPPAVVVPFSSDSEREQSLRAQRLVDRGLLTKVDGPALSGPSLAEALEKALELWQDRADGGVGLAMDGAARSADILMELLDGRGR